MDAPTSWSLGGGTVVGCDVSAEHTRRTPRTGNAARRDTDDWDVREHERRHELTHLSDGYGIHIIERLVLSRHGPNKGVCSGSDS